MFLLNGLRFDTLEALIRFKMYDNAMNGRAEMFGFKVSFKPYVES